MNHTHVRKPQKTEPEKVRAWQNTSPFILAYKPTANSGFDVHPNEWLVTDCDTPSNRQTPRKFIDADFRSLFDEKPPEPHAPPPSAERFGARIEKCGFFGDHPLFQVSLGNLCLLNDGTWARNGYRAWNSYDEARDALAHAQPPPGWVEPKGEGLPTAEQIAFEILPSNSLGHHASTTLRMHIATAIKQERARRFVVKIPDKTLAGCSSCAILVKAIKAAGGTVVP